MFGNFISTHNLLLSINCILKKCHKLDNNYN